MEIYFSSHDILVSPEQLGRNYQNNITYIITLILDKYLNRKKVNKLCLLPLAQSMMENVQDSIADQSSSTKRRHANSIHTIKQKNK